MTQAIGQFFSNVFGDNVILAVIVIALLPMIELKGAIPFGMSKSFWGKNALNAASAFGYSFVGSILVVPLLAIIFKPIYLWAKNTKFFGPIVRFFTGDIEQKSQRANTKVGYKKGKIFLKMLYVFLFVAFPVPLTGVWTGTCFAVLLGLNFWQVCLSVIVGNLVCGLIVAFVCTVFPQATAILLYIFIALVVLALTAKIIMHIIKKKKAQ